MKKSGELPSKKSSQKPAKTTVISPKKQISAINRDSNLFRTHKVFVGGTRSLQEDQIHKIFEKFGEIYTVEVVRKNEKDLAGFGLVTFVDAAVVDHLLNEQFVDTGLGFNLEVKPYMIKINKEKEIAEDEFLDKKHSATIQPPKLISIIEKRDRTRVLEIGESIEFEVIIANKSTQKRELKQIIPTGRTIFKILPHLSAHNNKTIQPASSYSFRLSFKPEFKLPGEFQQMFVFDFNTTMLQHMFQVSVHNVQDLEVLKPESTYVEKQELSFPKTMVAAYPPARATKNHIHTNHDTQYVVKLDQYPVPDDIMAQINALDRFDDLNPWHLKNNWIKRLHTLLYLEEAEGKKRMTKFDLENTKVEQVPPGLSRAGRGDTLSRVFVPGNRLAEKRPSVLPGDVVYAWVKDQLDFYFEGFVAEIEANSLLVIFCEDFHRRFLPSTEFCIRFSYARMTWRLQHRAADVVDVNVIWPTLQTVTTVADADFPLIQPPKTEEPPKKKKSKSSKSGKQEANSAAEDGNIELPKLKWKDSRMNEDQKQIIQSILTRSKGGAPYLIFGPFGTGKTSCLIELVAQITTLKPDARILFCTHTNSSCDAIVQKFSFTETEMLRLNGFHRTLESVPAPVRKYTIYNTQKEIYEIPDLPTLRRYKIIVSTVETSAQLFGVGIGSNHFTHIIIDEAAQMTEPHALIALSMANINKTTVVLAGDEKQLAPKVHAKISEHHGLQRSLLERLARWSPLYRDRTGFKYCHQLTKNYRSHSEILKVLSNLFYKVPLEAMADKNDTQSLSIWSKMGTNRDFPFLFYGLEGGKEEREGDSPSYFNRYEAAATVQILKDLMNAPQKEPLNQSDILVVPATRKQQNKLRTILRIHRLGGVRVESPEECHGKEAKAVFISTVRANPDGLEMDRAHDIGFIHNEKRINTAISRAVSLVVIVGDVRVLARSSHWNELIRICHERGGFISNLGPSIETASAATAEQLAKAMSPAAPLFFPSEVDSPKPRSFAAATDAPNKEIADGVPAASTLKETTLLPSTDGNDVARAQLVDMPPVISREPLPPRVNHHENLQNGSLPPHLEAQNRSFTGSALPNFSEQPGYHPNQPQNGNVPVLPYYMWPQFGAFPVYPPVHQREESRFFRQPMQEPERIQDTEIPSIQTDGDLNSLCVCKWPEGHELVHLRTPNSVIPPMILKEKPGHVVLEFSTFNLECEVHQENYNILVEFRANRQRQMKALHFETAIRPHKDIKKPNYKATVTLPSQVVEQMVEVKRTKFRLKIKIFKKIPLAHKNLEKMFPIQDKD